LSHNANIANAQAGYVWGHLVSGRSWEHCQEYVCAVNKMLTFMPVCAESPLQVVVSLINFKPL